MKKHIRKSSDCLILLDVAWPLFCSWWPFARERDESNCHSALCRLYFEESSERIIYLPAIERCATNHLNLPSELKWKVKRFVCSAYISSKMRVIINMYLAFKSSIISSLMFLYNSFHFFLSLSIFFSIASFSHLFLQYGKDLFLRYCIQLCLSWHCLLWTHRPRDSVRNPVSLSFVSPCPSVTRDVAWVTWFHFHFEIKKDDFPRLLGCDVPSCLLIIAVI